MEVRIKKLLDTAVIPQYATKGAACMDLTAVSRSFDDQGNVVYGTGLAFEIPAGYVGLIFARSSLSKYDLALSNCVGVIDSDYRGEVSFKFRPALAFRNGYCPHTEKAFRDYNVGDRIGQIMIIPYPKITFTESAELSTTQRGTGGYGSTGQGTIQQQ
jgi:dUTP pyrophosphatase